MDPYARAGELYRGRMASRRTAGEEPEALDALIEELADETLSEVEMESAFARLDAALETTRRDGHERPSAAQ